MLAINLFYLYLSGSVKLRPPRVVIAGAASEGLVALVEAAGATTRFRPLLLLGRAGEAFLLPFWDNYIAFLASRATFWDLEFFIRVISKGVMAKNVLFLYDNPMLTRFASLFITQP
jgi:hypothetical protein